MKVKLIEDGKMPTRATNGSNAFDCYARKIDVVGNTAVCHLGFSVDASSALPNFHGLSYGGILLPRSGWGSNFDFRLRNTIGLIDSDYRGEVIAKIKFDQMPTELYRWLEGQYKEQLRVCQIAFPLFYHGELQQVAELDDSIRGDGGFGHTD